MKKIVSIFMAILLIMSTMVFVSAGASAESSISSAVAEHGQEVTLTVTMSGAPAVQSGGFSVSYDSDVLEFVGGAWLLSGTTLANFGGMGIPTQGVFTYG